MQIYNTLSRHKEKFEPLNPPNVTMYVCGPTTYDYFHVGNARSFIMADVIRRYLDYKGYDVKYIMNLTDVDDKLIQKSKNEKISVTQVAEKYIKAFFEDIERLKIREATLYPKATDHMNEIIELIKSLEDKGVAYDIDGNVFYDVSKFDEYGKLSGKKTDELESGSRIEVNEEKKNPLDFALWKKTKEGEPYWESKWGKGRPGWHIECSAMSMAHLGKTIDIHAGGNDLIFPHHENEIAQSEIAHSQQFVKYWIHFGFLNIEEEKMSKSLGNFFTAREILEKFSAEALRLFFNQTYYRGPLSFNEELLQAAERGAKKLANTSELILEGISKSDSNGIMPKFNFEKYLSEFERAMDDDFNTPQATAAIFDVVREVNRIISEEENLNSEFFQKAKEFLEKTAQGVLGILDLDTLSKDQGKSLEKELLELFIEVRALAKKEKNFMLADQIRDRLTKLGIQLKDGKSGTTYKKVKTE